MRLNVKQIAACTGGSFVVDPADASALITGLTWDSRTVCKGDVYVALPGERVDGHEFIAPALSAGASAVLTMQVIDAEVTRAAQEAGAAIIEVPDTAHAITDLAREWRRHLKGRVIGVTGSVGKTTTKNLIRDVLSRAFTTTATAGNQNNELGVPKTILSAEADTQMVVVEMGMCDRGEIAELCSFVRPDWGVITTVGESHIEILGSRENIARAKTELFEALPEGCGRAFMNAACDFADFIVEESHLESRRVLHVSFDGSKLARDRRNAASPLDGPAVWAEDVVLDEMGRAHFRMHASGFGVPGVHGAPADESVACVLNVRGAHNVSNACAAAAVGLAAGMSLADIADALSQARPEAGRQELIAAPGGFTVINDAYNASPDSMQASLSMFCSLSVSGHRIAVLGNMGELGQFARDGHERVGRFVAELPVDRMICVGELASVLADAAETAGMDARCICRVRTVDEALAEVRAYVRPGDAVLVKASHFMELTRVVKGLVD
ncbi:UDP-N-acetylmuramoyl-tripeptide--D-alanyl-D-alanine ligase [Adlercreutzia sp. ZJ141]|uniref:UDP-N-acetylmuramoyl-tripeptide--D-alanyl-D- alanine ligase n=1 Tax=Adlercreutzia sp. ZJ141 TaxID=2709406 RepID=UPI0013EA089D|nr:UDP-N-acetylmuramoyl-tripeptide--D-alanyl-D-alanine ligase [Adlercreutzia sp. ZJ141]